MMEESTEYIYVPSRTKPAHLAQSLVALAATVGSFSFGCILGYSSPASPQLQEIGNSSDITANASCGGELSQSLDGTELSWFQSSVNIGALMGAPLAGLVMKTVGRRATMIGIAVPFAIGWSLIGMRILI